MHSMWCLKITEIKSITDIISNMLANAWQMSILRFEHDDTFFFFSLLLSFCFAKPQFNLRKAVSYLCHLIVFYLNELASRSSFDWHTIYSYLDDASKVFVSRKWMPSNMHIFRVDMHVRECVAHSMRWYAFVWMALEWNVCARRQDRKWYSLISEIIEIIYEPFSTIHISFRFA